jgi:DNA-binding NtrC family response regulator
VSHKVGGLRGDEVDKKQGSNPLSDQIKALDKLIRHVWGELNDLDDIARTLGEFEAINASEDQTVHPPFYEMVFRYEAHLIRQALERTAGHQTRAAKLLGVSVTTLNSMIKRYQINPLNYARGKSTQEESLSPNVKPDEKRRRGGKRAMKHK